MEFLTDYLRLMVGGNLNAFEIENLMDVEIETHHHEGEIPVGAIAKMADGTAGVRYRGGGDGRGAYHGVGRSSARRLGKLIAAALVGTFLGILLSYGFVGPLATLLEHKLNESARCSSASRSRCWPA